MVTHPVIGAISNMLWSFNSSSQGYIESIPQLQVLSHTVPCRRCFRFGVFFGGSQACKASYHV